MNYRKLPDVSYNLSDMLRRAVDFCSGCDDAHFFLSWLVRSWRKLQSAIVQRNRPAICVVI